MYSLLLAILSSASVAIVLKCFRAQRGNRFGIILGNYLTCILVSLALMPDRSIVLSGSGVTLLCGALGGCLFVAGLVSMQSSVSANGATLTAAFAKLGLLVSLALSILWFGERPGLWQIGGIVLALASVVVIHSGKDNQAAGESAAPSLGLLLLTLLACGGSDGMAKVFEQVGQRSEDTLYFFFVFLVAALLSAVLAVIEYRKTGKKILLPELAAGVAVGIPNYFSSYLLLKALVSLPAFLVYPVFSTGTILLVMAVSAVFFGERPGRRQLAGLVLVLAALVLLNI